MNDMIFGAIFGAMVPIILNCVVGLFGIIFCPDEFLHDASFGEAVFMVILCILGIIVPSLFILLAAIETGQGKKRD